MKGSSQHVTSISGIDFSILDDTLIHSIIFLCLARLCTCLVMSTWNKHQVEFEVGEARNSWLLFTMFEK